MNRVLITGGTGLVGKHLCKLLAKKGFEVLLLSTRAKPASSYKTFLWDWENGFIEQGALENADYIVHLAGAGIFDKRWTPARKKLIADSRIRSAQLLFRTIKEKQLKPKAFISASAVGYYGAFTSETIFFETDGAADDFLGQVCLKWESAANDFSRIGIRSVMLRTGVVLSEDAAILKSLSGPTRNGFGARIATGKQYMPWIHIDDLCAMYVKAIADNSMQGAYNAVAPVHITNAEFTNALADVFSKKIWLPGIPAFVLQLVFGERAQLLLTGSRVSSEKIVNAGYSYLYPELREALLKSIAT